MVLRKKTFSIIMSMVLALASVAAVPQQAQVAIYTGSGTWAEGIIALEHFLDNMGVTWDEVSAWDINNYDLKNYYDAIIMPGGYAYNYKKSIKSSGINHIRDLVNTGGAYIGICAGAYYASDTVEWEGGTYDYPLKLFKGTTYGAIDAIEPWDGYTMTTINMNLDNPINANEHAQEVMLYYGGPEFYPDASQPVETLALWDATGARGIINFDYGNGRVLLNGAHAEIEEDSGRDGTAFADELGDAGTDWNFLESAFRWALNLTPLPPPPPDTEAPVINMVNDEPDPVTQGSIVRISANVTDNKEVNNVLVDIGGTVYDMLLDSGSSSEILFDGFESGSMSNWFLYGTGVAWKADNVDPYTGSYHAYAEKTGAGENSYMEIAVSTEGYSDISVEYYRKLVGLDTADNSAAEWFDADSWYPLEELGSKSENNNNYQFKTFILPSGADNNPNFKLRFMCECGAVTESCSVDNVRLIATETGTGYYVYNHDTNGMSIDVHPYTVYANDTSSNEALPVSGNFTVI